MKRLLLTAAALALLTTTAAAFTFDRAVEADFSIVVDPQKVVTTDRLRASVSPFSTSDREYVDVAPGTMMTVIKQFRDGHTIDSDNVCALLPETTTKGLQAWSPSGCFWVYLKGASQ